MESNRPLRFVVLGGGIAGISCAEELLRILNERQYPNPPSVPVEVLLVTASPLLKAIVGVSKLSKTLEQFEIESIDADEFLKLKKQEHSNNKVSFRIVKGLVSSVAPERNSLIVRSKNARSENFKGIEIHYDKLCVCTGARPISINSDAPELVFGIRDTDSVEHLRKRLQRARKIVLIGAGGIAMEFAHAFRSCRITWVMRKENIGAEFLDKSSAAFLIPFRWSQEDPKIGIEKLRTSSAIKHPISHCANSDRSADFGPALGPNWISFLDDSKSELRNEFLQLETNCDIVSVRRRNVSDNEGEDFEIEVELSSGKKLYCDFVISATGVIPNTDFLRDQVLCDSDGAIIVNELLQSVSHTNIFSAGDCCSVKNPDNPLWFQMRLWFQAKTMGAYSAHAMCSLIDQELGMWIQFEIFSHVTSFFGQKVVLLGKFNAQGLGIENVDYKVLMRVKPQEQYVKLIIQDGKVKGAVLIGETHMEETVENLILNQLDVSAYGDEMLRDDVDLDDYFD